MKFRPYTEGELADLRRSGQILSEALRVVTTNVVPGISAIELDEIAERSIREQGGLSAFKGYHGFPATLCVSVNDEVVHGIPTSAVLLNEGSLVGLDLGVIVNGMYTDMATTAGVGTIDSSSQKLIDATRRSLAAGLKAVKAGARTGDIGAAVQAVAEAAGFAVVRDLVGHGVGRAVHEDPSIPNFGKRGTGSRLVAGMTIAVEPMLTVGEYSVKTDDDGWTVRTTDGSLASHEERTVLVTDRGYELITPFWE